MKQLLMSFCFPFSETNSLPSLTRFNNPEQGVPSRLRPDDNNGKPYPSNGMSCDDVAEFSAIRKADKLDALGLASAKLDKRMNSYSVSGLHTYVAQQVASSRRNK